MCKYCDVKPTNIAAEEYDNLTTIAKTRGNIRVVLEMYTYQIPEKKISELGLIMEGKQTDSDIPAILAEKRIKIKFCPFCGRSLT